MSKRGHRLLAACAVLVLMGAACAPNDSEGGGDDESTTTEATVVGDITTTGDFGDLGTLCKDGPGVEINADENGGDTVKIAVGTDRKSVIRPNLNAILWDTSVAFSEWCNAQGGLNGTKIELVDMDGNVVDVDKAMTLGCSEAFAMVGGGFAQDQLELPKFTACNMVDISGFAVSAEKSTDPRTVQPLPNPPTKRPVAWFEDLVALDDTAFEKTSVVFGDLPSIEQNKDQIKAAAADIEGFGFVDDVVYSAINDNDWPQVAQKAVSTGATAMSFVGEVENFARFLSALRTAGFDGPVFADVNQYDPALIDAAGPDADGVYLRTAFTPFNESDSNPATKQMLDMFAAYSPDAEPSGLAVNSFTSWLLFATAFNECADSAPVTRDCILDTAKGITSWTGGGLHAESNPGEGLPAACSALVTVENGAFVRAYPELGSDADNGDGYSCADPGYVTIDG